MGKRVSLFVTCLGDQLFPNAPMAAAEVLERLGYTVEVPEGQTCCGQPAFNSGYRDEARAVARHFLKVFGSADFIVSPSGSCTSMVAHHYSDLFRKEPDVLEKLESLQSRTYEFTAFLTNVARVDDVGACFQHAVTLHDSCHALRELHISAGPRRLLSKVKGLELREMSPAEECCGFGGTFAVKFGELSTAMARTKVDAILRTGAQVVTGVDSSCLMQIHGALAHAGSSVRAVHIAEILASR